MKPSKAMVFNLGRNHRGGSLPFFWGRESY